MSKFCLSTNVWNLCRILCILRTSWHEDLIKSLKSPQIFDKIFRQHCQVKDKHGAHQMCEECLKSSDFIFKYCSNSITHPSFGIRTWLDYTGKNLFQTTRSSWDVNKLSRQLALNRGGCLSIRFPFSDLPFCLRRLGTTAFVPFAYRVRWTAPWN